HCFTCCFLHTPPLNYIVQRNPAYFAVAYDICQRIDSCLRQGATSPVTLAECLIMPVRLGLIQPQQDFADVLVQGANMTFVPLDAAIARNTAELRVKYNLGLADAFQVAAALA